MSSIPSSSGVRLPGATVAIIDLLRGGLALLVLVAHTVETARQSYSLPVIGPECGALATLVMQGSFWVGGFFVLSGFCVHLSVQKLLSSQGPWLRHYALARVTRIYPMFLVSLLLLAANWRWLGPHPLNSVTEPVAAGTAHLLMLQGITGVFHELKPAWSLTYEMLYYAAWPLLILISGRCVQRAFYLGTGIALSIAVAVVGVWKILHGGDGGSWLIPFWLIPAQFLLWLGGAFLAHSWRPLSAFIGPRGSWLAFAGLISVFVFQGWLVLHDARQWMLLACGYLALPCWLVLLLASARLTFAEQWGWLVRHMALLSYPLYLLHQLILDLASRLWPQSPEISPVIYGVVLGVATLTIIWMAGIPMERTFLKWRSAWLKKWPAGKVSPSAVTAQAAN